MKRDHSIMRFNWRFWEPIECIGGKCFFGTYYECWTDGSVSLQTREQYYIKKLHGYVT